MFMNTEILFLKNYDYGEPVWFKNYKRKTYDCRRCDRVHESGIKLTCAEFAEYLSEKQGHEVSSCLFHMSDAEVDDLIAESMKEKFYEMVDSMMLQKATLDVRKEWELAFDQRYGYRYNRFGYISLGVPVVPKVYKDVAERSKNKVFKNYLLKFYETVRCEKNAKKGENILPFYPACSKL